MHPCNLANAPSASHGKDAKLKTSLVILQDNCPRCGWELERGLKMEDAQDHLDNCNNAKEIAAYKKKMAEKKSMTEKKKVQEELQEDIQVYLDLFRLLFAFRI